MKQVLLCVMLLLVPAAGWGGDGMVALVTCDPSCPDDSGDRYVDCDNGTVTDNETGLVWLANANCFGRLTWGQAMAAVAGLADLPDDGKACDSLTPDECDCGLSDGSSPGEWRLPSIEEWEAMVEQADEMLCSPTITNDAGDECWDEYCNVPCSFYNVGGSWFWSSSTYFPTPTYVWLVDLMYGEPTDGPKTGKMSVWPVRGGQ